MGSHARPNRIHRTGVRVAMVALVGAALPITASGLAQAATPGATHSADENGRQGGEATAGAAHKQGTQRQFGSAQAGRQHAVEGKAAAAQAAKDQDAPQIHADHAFLLDARDGSQERELWGGAKADESVSMASTTKIMTAMVVLKHPEWLNRQITVKQEYRDYVQKVGGSTADLQTGDTLTVEQLLHAMLIPSGDDAAMALADNFGAGATADARIDDFVSQMNVEAQQLGLAGTHFDGFDGISHGSNYSTARDLAKLGQRAMLQPVFADIVKNKQFKAEAPAANGHTRYYTWDNTNKLLGSYDGALGIKTGSGPEAGYALVFAAKRDNRTLVGAILKDDQGSRFDDAAKMLDWGFAH
ncbi:MULTISPECIES: D-alanyl-D-alanine carboxypeptidase family protein [unclassified Streptomyces]|uniref:D-alanyl-D-alanine carboxypeptidase family protein n=1 Tax=unclassified Streptomyces TaxID=2593676 RepID=UPI0008882043|nr:MULTISPECIES: serine hydrolase [unclassified Streptomyces]PBC85873.1 D-alanyl-D-alanine carboxypeptidase (penicillin-binding protein 5/6) [Streptomyces sp. 2321.6]SDR03541.1 D-alanyl-D-alanine carboxypeptidase (penicillin-binding protein 5/6) [Streptomyces sp. KS_16]SED81614.1 D-alanyl-D-alanine carboxypeptidase (penicillin-binding protein 5/6) [Streptomyces sp. 2133.1]SNC72754.1 D-alanyl-D-alanine carboxypeptidase (penicillin-binding protein 5/6) [Streptomyces sp. 2114.4]